MYTYLHTRILTVLVNRIEHEKRTNLEKLYPDLAFGCTHNDSNAIQVALYRNP
jgi:hypothetical protein